MQKSVLLGVSVGESFAEYTLLSDLQPIAHSRALLSRENLKQSLRQFLSLNAEVTPQRVFVSLRLPQRLLNFNLSGAVAHVATHGFEQWLSLCSSKTQQLTSRDMLFSVRERVLADGTVEVPLDLSELAQVAEKIKLTGIKKVCLHFLHSSVHPQHAILARNFLQSEGLDVFVPQSSDVSDEVLRWKKNALNATASGGFAERKLEIFAALEGRVPYDCIHFLNAEGKIASRETPQEVDSLFSSSTAMGRIFGAPEKADVLYLGLEHFLLISGSEWVSAWHGPWGAAEVPHLKTKELSIQPTSSITLNSFGRFDFASFQEGWEPGPMFMGRGQKLSLLDLWAENTKIGKIQGLEDRISPQGVQRFKNSLLAFSKISKSRDSEIAHLTKDMQSLALQRLAIESVLRRQRKKLIVSGPLATVFANVFKKDPYSVILPQEFCESQAVALCGAQAQKEVL